MHLLHEMIEINQLVKKFDQTVAVNGISLSVGEGKTLALVGTSGCGKTTTLKMINRLIEPTSGTIALKGNDVQQISKVELRRKIGYVIQNIGLFPHYTIKENIAVIPRLLKWKEDKIDERIRYLLGRLKLPPQEYLNKFPDQLSGGQQQRVGIARALAADPPFILMDEPFGALDPITRESIRNDFKEIEELANKTTVIVTHDIEEAFKMADLICVLDKGEVQQLGTPRELLYQPANAFIRSFIGEKKLQLELQASTVEEVFPHLQTREGDKTDKTIDIDPGTSIMEALTILNLNDDNNAGMTKFNGETKSFNLSILMDAFQKRDKLP